MSVRPWSRSHDLIHVAGTVGRGEDGGPVAGAAAQADRIVTRIGGWLGEAGAVPADVVRQRVYLVDAADWPAVCATLEGWYGGSLPPTTVVAGVVLIERWMRVEVEVDARAPAG